VISSTHFSTSSFTTLLFCECFLILGLSAIASLLRHIHIFLS
jgi:hypothetical protein